MADKKNNPLAKLAEKLNLDADIVLALKKYLGDKDDEIGGMMIQDIRKACRIVEELASYHDFCFPSKSGDDVIDECRAIAEEGDVK